MKRDGRLLGCLRRPLPAGGWRAPGAGRPPAYAPAAVPPNPTHHIHLFPVLLVHAAPKPSAPSPGDPPAGGNGALGEALNAREQLAEAAVSCAVGQALAPRLDYLIGCEYNAASDQLWLLAGNNLGAVGFFPVAEPPTQQLPSDGGGGAAQPAAGAQQAQQQQQQALFRAPQAVLAGGGGAHGDVVRSVLWPGAAGGMCLSGGEDSKICAWSLQPVAAAAGTSAATSQHSASGSSGSSGAVRKHHTHHQQAQQQHQHHQQRQRRGAPY